MHLSICNILEFHSEQFLKWYHSVLDQYLVTDLTSSSANTLRTNLHINFRFHCIIENTSSFPLLQIIYSLTLIMSPLLIEHLDIVT